MVLVVGNKKQVNPNPNGSFYQTSHTQNTGADGLLLVSFCMFNSRNYTGCTYGGQAMTQVLFKNLSGLQQRVVMYKLESPPTGSNTLRVNFNGGQYNPISLYARSFTGASIANGTPVNLGGSNSPKTGSIIVQGGSHIYSMSVSINVIQSIQINGVGTTALYTANTNRQVRGGRAGPFTAGTIALRNTGVNLTMHAIEIREASSTPPPTSSNFMIMF